MPSLSHLLQTSPTPNRHTLPEGESFSSALTKRSIGRTQGFEQITEGLRSRGDQDVNDIGQERRRVGAAAGSAVQQKFGVVRGRRGFARNLEQTIRRGKARQGIKARGDEAVRNQQLKDRLALARQDIARRGVIQGANESAGRLRTGLDRVEVQAQDSVNQAFAGAAGSIAGGLASGFGDRLFNSNTDVVPVGTDRGTAAADAINSSGFDFSFGPENVGIGVDPDGVMLG